MSNITTREISLNEVPEIIGCIDPNNSSKYIILGRQGTNTLVYTSVDSSNIDNYVNDNNYKWICTSSYIQNVGDTRYYLYTGTGMGALAISGSTRKWSIYDYNNDKTFMYVRSGLHSYAWYYDISTGAVRTVDVKVDPTVYTPFYFLDVTSGPTSKPVKINGQDVNKIMYNGVEIQHLIYNGNNIF